MPNQSPNILFVMCDDMGAWAMGRGASPDAVTPTLDRLAKEGTRLNNHFSLSAVCSPSRACVLTGKYCLEVGIPDFLCGDDDKTGLDPKHMTLPKAFQQNGYNTGLFGKWHLGHTHRFHPTQNGYDQFVGFRIGGGEGPLSSQDPTIEIDGRYEDTKGYTSDIITDHALDFIKVQKNKPFFASVHYWAPHANQGVSTEDGDRTWHPLKDEDWAPFKDIDPAVPNPDYPKLDTPRVKRMMREYLASVHSVDRNIARLYAQLKAQGILDNTVIVFTSDNGFNLGHHGIWHKGNGWWILTDNRGDRPNLYDHSMRVPALIRWPSKVKANQCIENSNTSLDWFPTLLEYAGIDQKDDWNLRGESITPELAGEPASKARPIFGQYSMWEWNQTGADMRSYRTEQWKLMVDLKKTVPNEFYDLTNDPLEMDNIYESSTPEILEMRKAMEAALFAHMTQVNDPAALSA